MEVGADVDIQNVSVTRVLLETAGESYAGVTHPLLEHRASVPLQPENGEIALSKAAGAEHDRVVRQLSMQETTSESGSQQQMHATEMVLLRGYKDVVEFLFEGMADLRYTDGQGGAVLHHTAVKGRIFTNLLGEVLQLIHDVHIHRLKS